MIQLLSVSDTNETVFILPSDYHEMKNRLTDFNKYTESAKRKRIQRNSRNNIFDYFHPLAFVTHASQSCLFLFTIICYAYVPETPF